MRITYHWIKKLASEHGVRRIPISTRSLTGEVLGTEFESALERDLMLLMSFDRTVDSFQSQPVRIHYEYPGGGKRHYTPDLLIAFTPSNDFVTPQPMLCEVKYREDLSQNWRELRHKFRAARAHCKEFGWRFEVFDEHRIRTHRLANIQFLWKYRTATYGREFAPIIFEHLKAARRPLRMVETVNVLFSSDEDRGAAIWAWWCLVAKKLIECDLEAPFGRDTTFGLPDWRYL